MKPGLISSESTNYSFTDFQIKWWHLCYPPIPVLLLSMHFSRTAVYVREGSIVRVYTATLSVSVKAELALLQLKLGPSKMLTRWIEGLDAGELPMPSWRRRQRPNGLFGSEKPLPLLLGLPRHRKQLRSCKLWLNGDRNAKAWYPVVFLPTSEVIENSK